MYMFCVVVTNKKKYCFEEKNWIASKTKRFLSSTNSEKWKQELKICLKRGKNQPKIILILVIAQFYEGEVSNDLLPKGFIFCSTLLYYITLC